MTGLTVALLLGINVALGAYLTQIGRIEVGSLNLGVAAFLLVSLVGKR